MTFFLFCGHISFGVAAGIFFGLLACEIALTFFNVRLESAVAFVAFPVFLLFCGLFWTRGLRLLL